MLVSKKAVVKKTTVRNRARDQLEFYAIKPWILIESCTTAQDKGNGSINPLETIATLLGQFGLNLQVMWSLGKQNSLFQC